MRPQRAAERGDEEGGDGRGVGEAVGKAHHHSEAPQPQRLVLHLAQPAEVHAVLLGRHALQAIAPEEEVLQKRPRVLGRPALALAHVAREHLFLVHVRDQLAQHPHARGVCAAVLRGLPEPYPPPHLALPSLPIQPSHTNLPPCYALRRVVGKVLILLAV